MSRRYTYRFKSERKRSCLTQEELAYLVGLRTASAESRLERGEREPEFRTGLAYEIVFNCSGAELFPVVYEEVEALVLQRAVAVADRLRQIDQSNRIAYKLKRLEDLLARRISLMCVWSGISQTSSCSH
jgi:transcriptional regulator with XRE-family HTH domain